MGRKGKEEIEFKGKFHVRWDLHMVMARNKVKTAAHLSRLLGELGVNFSSVYLSRIIYERPSMLNLTLLDALICIFDCTPNDILVIEPYEAPEAGHTASEPRRSPTGTKSTKPASKSTVPKAAAPPKPSNVTELRQRTNKPKPKTPQEQLAEDFLNLPAYVLPPKDPEE
jgi:DNA-binding Xre family transcriptional regulator